MNIFRLLQEAKDHIIKKLDLTDEQKEEIIAFFKRRPDLESKIDWNKKSELDYDFFQEFIKEADNQATRGNLRNKGIGTFVEGKDYHDISLDKDYLILIPRTYEFQKFIQSTRFYETEAEWCIGYQKEDKYWKRYHITNNFIIFIDKKNKDKIACQIPVESTEVINIWNVFDKNKFLRSSHKNKISYYQDHFSTEFVSYIYNNLETVILNFFKKLNIKPKGAVRTKKLIVDQEGVGRFEDGDFYQIFGNLVNYPKNDLSEEVVLSNALIDFTNIPNISDCKKLIINTKNLKFLFDYSEINEKLSSIETIDLTIGKRLDMENDHLTLPGFPNLKNLKIEMDQDYKETYKVQHLKLQGGMCSWCENLENVILDDDFRVIESNAFYKCKNLKTIKLPKELMVIGHSAFSESGLEKIEFNSNLISIEPYAFQDCKNLKEIVLNNKAISIGLGAFINCSSLSTDLKFSNDVFLESYAFAGTGELNIDFSQCPKLRLGDQTFSNSSLKSIILPKDLKLLPNDTFYCCENLDEVVLPEDLKEIRHNVFALSTIKKLKLPKSISVMGENNFRNCEDLVEVDLSELNPKLLISKNTFRMCPNIERVIFNPDFRSVKSYFPDSPKVQFIAI